MWLLLSIACTVAAPDRTAEQVDEAFDVPPPPGHRTLRLDGVSPEGIALGDRVRLRVPGTETIGDVVLDEPGSLTVYVPEDAADPLLAAGAVTVVP